MQKLKFAILFLAISFSLLSCLKDNAFMDVSNTQPVIEFSFGTNGTSDLGNFGADPTADKLDTAIALNIASPQTLDYPVTVTLKIDPSIITRYNGVASNTPLNVLPDSTFRLKTTTVTIPAGYRIAKIPITLFPNKIDPGKSYGLPISITNATGTGGQNLIVSSNAGIALYAFIGNPLSGSYTWNFTRYNGDSTTAPNGSSFVGQTATTKIVDPTTLLFPDSYLTTFVGSKAGLTISFKNNNGTISNPTVSFDAGTTAGLAAAGFTISQAPILLSYKIAGSSANGYSGSTFRTYFVVINSSGGTRTLVDLYVKQ